MAGSSIQNPASREHVPHSILIPQQGCSVATLLGPFPLPWSNAYHPCPQTQITGTQLPFSSLPGGSTVLTPWASTVSPLLPAAKLKECSDKENHTCEISEVKKHRQAHPPARIGRSVRVRCGKKEEYIQFQLCLKGLIMDHPEVRMGFHDTGGGKSQDVHSIQMLGYQEQDKM